VRTLTYTARPEDDGRLLRRLVRGPMGVSHHIFSSLKMKGGILLDGAPARANQKVAAGQVISLTLLDPQTGIQPDPTPVDVVYEDEDILIVNKSAPLACQHSARQQGFALENRLKHRFGDNYVFRPVNRLDKGTSGLMAVARHAHAQMILAGGLHTDAFVREYLAVVCGRLEGQGVVDAPIRKAAGATIRREVAPDGKPARTRYRALETRGGLTLVRLRLETGRTHQIRVHMRHMGCPVLGDFLYGEEDAALPGRFALHAWRIILPQPMTGRQLEFEAPPPEVFGRWRCLEPGADLSRTPL
jgi:23S rRNA pseudouridine1911/1915/1917 synthase